MAKEEHTLSEEGEVVFGNVRIKVLEIEEEEVKLEIKDYWEN